MAIELSSDAERWLGRLPEIVNLVLVALIGLALAHLFWLIWPQPPATAIAPVDANSNARTANQKSINVDAIAGAHIFGKQEVVSTDQEKQKELNAPETHLNLVLTGIIADSQNNRSRVLIKNPQGSQDSYRVGDSIISGVNLHAVYPNKVILDRGGHFETLTLESIKNAQSMSQAAGYSPPSRGTRSGSTSSGSASNGSSSGGSPSSRSTSSTSTSNASTSASSSSDSASDNENLADIRRRIVSDPSTVRRYIRLQPARQGGNLVGYRVFPGEDKALFEKAGLKSGELVTAINGQSLDNPAASLQVLNNLARAPSATITVQGDDGKSRNVRVDF